LTTWKEVFVIIKYFKANGKFYSIASGNVFVKGELTEPREIGNFLRDSSSLPGISNGKWGDYFTVSVGGACEDLILPK